MNWAGIVLDGLAMCVVFNVSTALLGTIKPTAFPQMMPKEIRKAAPKLTRRDFIILAVVLHPMQLLIIVYMALSAINAGVSGFWPLFMCLLAGLVAAGIGWLI